VAGGLLDGEDVDAAFEVVGEARSMWGCRWMPSTTVP
jgi:hypothetical protein